jgi:hypothetical protein
LAAPQIDGEKDIKQILMINYSEKEIDENLLQITCNYSFIPS